MKTTSIKKCQVAGLNDKRYYFSDGTVYFLFGHLHLEEIRKYQKDAKDKMQKVIKKTNLKCSEMKLRRNLMSILLQPFTYYKLDFNNRLSSSQFNKLNFINTKDNILNSHWL